MIHLRLEPTTRDGDGWAEIVLVTQPMDEDAAHEFANNDRGDAEEPIIVGHIREVEGTEDGPTVWYDARVIDDGGVQQRRFLSLEAAVLALGMRRYVPSDTRKVLGW
jgi:hypothetical protein